MEANLNWLINLLALSSKPVTLSYDSFYGLVNQGFSVSLFSDNNYQYRETYFVLFPHENRPAPDKLQSVLANLGPKYETVDVVIRDDGGLESLTVKSPTDFSAMDITYTHGEEVTTQISTLMEDMRTMTLSGDDLKKLTRLKECDARFDIFHFEESSTASPDDEFLDPGGLLIVLNSLSELCDGVSLDPQSQTLM